MPDPLRTGVTDPLPIATARKRQRRLRAPDLRFERGLLHEGNALVGGVDEVGRGAWAGPLVVGIVVVDEGTAPLKGVRDSKQLRPRDRTRLAEEIKEWCQGWSLGSTSAGEIDEHGLSCALRLAARRALDALDRLPDALLIDGGYDFIGDRADEIASPLVADNRPTTHTLVRGDQRSSTIASASILAKVARDEEMVRLAESTPDYGFEMHKGYGTALHREAVAACGVTAHHRRTWSFAADRVAD
jgi:ribonuclease HII